MGSIITRTVILSLGYVYPAYMCYQNLEANKPKNDELCLWCQYWIIMALLTAFERLADTLISWFPFYNAAKIAFIIYLWHPQTKGTAHIYARYIKPLAFRPTQDTDQNWVQLKSQVIETSRMYWNKSLRFAQLKFAEMITPPSVNSNLQRNSAPNLPCERSIHNAKGMLAAHQKQEDMGGDRLLFITQAVAGHPLPYVDMTTKHSSKAQVGSALTKISASLEKKEDIDFELLDANEIPVAALSNPKKMKKAGFLWWW